MLLYLVHSIYAICYLVHSICRYLVNSRLCAATWCTVYMLLPGSQYICCYLVRSICYATQYLLSFLYCSCRGRCNDVTSPRQCTLSTGIIDVTYHLYNILKFPVTTCIRLNLYYTISNRYIKRNTFITNLYELCATLIYYVANQRGDSLIINVTVVVSTCV